MVDTEWLNEGAYRWIWPIPLMFIGLASMTLECSIWGISAVSVGPVTANQIFGAVTGILTVLINAALVLAQYRRRQSSGMSVSFCACCAMLFSISGLLLLSTVSTVFLVYFDTLWAAAVCYPGSLTSCPQNYGVTEFSDHHFIKLGGEDPISSKRYNSLVKSVAIAKIIALIIELVGASWAVVGVCVEIARVYNRNQNMAANEEEIPMVPTESSLKLCAWMYPVDLWPKTKDVRPYRRKGIYMLRVASFDLDAYGALSRVSWNKDKFNPFSAKNLKDIKNHCKEQLATVTCREISKIRSLLQDKVKQKNAAITLRSFVAEHALTGVDLCLENFKEWSPTDYTNFKDFVATLSQMLHTNGNNYKLAVCGPAGPKFTFNPVTNWNYTDFTYLSVDYISPLTNEFMRTAGGGGGSATVPIIWLQEWANGMLQEFPKNQLIMYISSCGYRAPPGGYDIDILTLNQIKQEHGYEGGVRNQESFETRKIVEQNDKTKVRDPVSGDPKKHIMEKVQAKRLVYVSNDTISLNEKKAALEAMQVQMISIYRLGGGNEWFSSVPVLSKFP